MAKKSSIKVYRLKIIFDAESKEILHLSECLDRDGDITFNIKGEDLPIPEEMYEMLDKLDDDILGIA